MQANELADFIAAAKASHSYSDAAISKYLDRIAKGSSGEQFSQMMRVLKSHRPNVYAAVMRHLSDPG